MTNPVSGGFQFSPATGLNDTATFPTTPINEVAARQQFMDLFWQLMNEINAPTASAAAYAQYNKIINGNADVWNEGYSVDVAGSVKYTAEMWCMHTAGAVYNVSRQPVTDLPGSEYCTRITYKTAGANDTYFREGFEADVFHKLKSKKATVSFKARKSGTPLAFTAALKKTASESSAHDGTVIGTINAFTSQITNVSQLFSFTVDMPPTTDTNKGLQLVFQTTMTNINEYIEISQIQLNAGEQALSFQPRSRQEEELLTQRFYEKSYDKDTVPGAASYPTQPIAFGSGSLAASTAGNAGLICMIPFKVRKRITPTVTLYDFDGTVNAIRVSPANAKRAGVTAVSGLKDTGTFQFLSLDASSATAIAAGSDLGANWVADARL